MKKLLLVVLLAASQSYAFTDAEEAEIANSGCKAVTAEVEAEAQRRAKAQIADLIEQLPENYESLEEELGKLNEKGQSFDEIYAQVVEEYKEALNKYCQ